MNYFWITFDLSLADLRLSNWDESDHFSQSPSSAERFVVVDKQSDYSGNIQSFESDEIVEVLDEILIFQVLMNLIKNI